MQCRVLISPPQDYASQCQKFLLDGGRHVSVSTHADVIEIASKIHQDHERASLHHDISKQPGGSTASAASIDGSLNLCSRLLLMVNVGEPPLGIDGPNTIRWDTGSVACASSGRGTSRTTCVSSTTTRPFPSSTALPFCDSRRSACVMRYPKTKPNPPVSALQVIPDLKKLILPSFPPLESKPNSSHPTS